MMTTNSAMAAGPAGKRSVDECTDIKNTCKEALEAADRLQGDLLKNLKESDLQIELLNSQITELEGDKLAAEQAANAWYRNPFLFLAAGAVIGAFVAK
jgi:hypothetical protein